MFGSLARSEAIALPVHRTEEQLRDNSNSSYAPGVSAIQPYRQATDRSQAAYGRSDVEQFFADNPLFIGGRAVQGAKSPALGDVEFLTVAQASARLNNEPIGRADDVLVCWVEIIGPLDVSVEISLPATMRTTSPRIPPAPKEILVFDAQTGNLLLSTYGPA